MGHKAIFLDRDDTLINDPGYIKSPDQVKLLPGAAEAVVHLKKLGYLIVIITNQSAVARGYITEKQLDSIHNRLKSLLAADGAYVDGLYYCPHHPEGTVAGFNQESHLRKPNPGMLRKAANELGIDLKQSWMVGDTYRDIQAGKAAGCHTILVDVPGKTREMEPGDPLPDRKAVNLREVVNIIRMYEFHQKAQAAKKKMDESAPPAAPTPPKDNHTVSEPELEIKQPPKPENETEKKTAFESRPQTTQTMDRHLEPGPLTEALPMPPIKVHTAKPTPEPEKESDRATEHPDKTHHLLQEILQRVTSSKRSELYDDFSAFKLLAGMAQIIALFCIIFSLWFWLSPKVGPDAVQIMIGYAIALQLLVMH